MGVLWQKLWHAKLGPVVTKKKLGYNSSVRLQLLLFPTKAMQSIYFTHFKIMFIVSFLSLPWNGRAPVSISYWKFTKAKTIRFWHCSFSRHGRKVNTWSQTNAGSKRAVNNIVLLNHTVRKKRLCNVVCGILVVSLPTSSETKFHLVQALCSAFALCQHGEAASVCETELLWPSQTVCQWVYCNVFSFSPNKWSKLCNRDVNVSGSYLSPFCLAMFKTKWAKSLSSSCSDICFQEFLFC